MKRYKQNIIRAGTRVIAMFLMNRYRVAFGEYSQHFFLLL